MRMRTSRLLRTLRGLEEVREVPQVHLAELVEMRHRRPRGDAGRALQVVDLELDPAALRTLLRQIGRTQVGRARAEVRVAGQAACLGEELRPRERRLVAHEALFLRP